MQKSEQVYGFVGLARRAGQISSGAVQVSQDIKRGKAHLVIIAADASNNTKDDYRSSCEYYQIPYIIWGKKAELGYTIGKSPRTVIAVLDQGFADRLKELLAEEIDMD